MAISTIGTDSISGLGYGFKNRIINGAMMIDQRNAGASVTPVNGAYTLDRWLAIQSQPSKFSVQQNAGSVTLPVGFTNYLGASSLSAYSVGSTENFEIQQRVEGLNVADLAWGTASASAVTLSFYVYSSLTGTFGGFLCNGATNYSYPFGYTVSAANTWQKITVTVAGPTSGTWLTTNGIGMFVGFSLGAGSSTVGTGGSWYNGTLYRGVTGQVNVVGTNGATFYITGVQLEKGNVATSFDYRPYGTELALCQRYYSTSFPYGTAPVQASGLVTWKHTHIYSGYGEFCQIPLPVSMRAVPTITGYNPAVANGLVRDVAAGVDFTYTFVYPTTTTSFTMQFYGGTSDATGSPSGWNWSASAEL